MFIHSGQAGFKACAKNKRMMVALPVIIPSNRTYKPSVGWADAATVIPWTIYQHTGDKKYSERKLRDDAEVDPVLHG